MPKSNDTKSSTATGLPGFVRIQKVTASTEDQYASRAKSWDDATVEHCLDMIEEGRMRMPFKVRVVQAIAVERGLATTEG